MVQDGNWLGREENHMTALFMATKEEKIPMKAIISTVENKKGRPTKWISWIEVTDNVKVVVLVDKWRWGEEYRVKKIVLTYYCSKHLATERIRGETLGWIRK